MAKLDITVMVECDGEQHGLHVLGQHRRWKKQVLEGEPRADYVTVTPLEHDQQTINAFASFGAARPRCYRLAFPLSNALNWYYELVNQWTGVEWMTQIGSNQLDLKGMTPSDVEYHLEQARLDELDRIDPLLKKLRVLRWEAEDHQKEEGYVDSITADRIRDLEEQIETEKQLYLDWQEALDYVETIEAAALDANHAATAVRNALVLGDFDLAEEKLKPLRRAGREGDNAQHWQPFVDGVIALKKAAG